jgi:hypothetical protein
MVLEKLRNFSVTISSWDQCCQLTEISAEKYKSGRIYISATVKICGRIFYSFTKKTAEKGRLF